jgi:hypothetical protein
MQLVRSWLIARGQFSVEDQSRYSRSLSFSRAPCGVTTIASACAETSAWATNAFWV